MSGRSDWLLFVHVASAFLFFGAAVTMTIAGVSASRAADPRQAALLARLANRVAVLLLWPSLVILVAAGAQLASKEDVYGRGWLRYGMVLTGVVAVLAGGVGAWATARRRRLGEAAQEAERLRRNLVPTVVGTISLILLAIVFWLMTAKPGIYD